MLINNTNLESSNVKFIGYTGKFPNRCSGVLTLEIDGKEYKFGHNNKYNFTTGIFADEDADNPNYGQFWNSSGCSWTIDVLLLPEQFRKYAIEIDKVFNDNVAGGCCGGCS